MRPALGANPYDSFDVNHNSKIPEDKKATLVGIEKARCARLEQSTQKFVQRGEYAKLPTKAEQIKAEKELAEKERRKRSGKRDETTTQAEKAEQTQRDAPSGKKSSVSQRDCGEKPESQELRKVRRAKANAARYRPCYQTEAEATGEFSQRAINTQA